MKIILDLTDKLGEIGRTKGPSSPEFRQTLETLNREYSRISPIRKKKNVPDVIQSNGSGRGDTLPIFPEVPSGPHKP